MTLLLTECSMAGVVMAADSAITMMRKGRIVDVDQSGWKKVLRVPRVHAAVGFWGEIGRIHSQQRFDEWLKQEIERATYSDLPSLAAALADTLNKAYRISPWAMTSVLVFMLRAIILGRMENAGLSFSMCTMAPANLR